jgi:hypothetical protein
MTIWHFFGSSGTFSRFWYHAPRKNLATLYVIRRPWMSLSAFKGKSTGCDKMISNMLCKLFMKGYKITYLLFSLFCVFWATVPPCFEAFLICNT